jgi:calcium-dependent protein kinase
MDKHKLISKERLEKTFSLFDKDGNGFLTPDELRDFFGPMNVDEDALKKIIQQVDLNKDGKV